MSITVTHLGDTPQGESVVAIYGMVPHKNYHVTVTFPSHDHTASPEAFTTGHGGIRHPNIEERARVKQIHYNIGADPIGTKILSYQILEEGDVIIDVVLVPEPEQHHTVVSPVTRTKSHSLKMGRTS